MYYPTGCNADCTGQVKRGEYQAHIEDKNNMNLAIAGLFRKVDELQDEILVLEGGERATNGTADSEKMSSNGRGLWRKRLRTSRMV